MTRCRHPELVLPRSRERVRCRRCGLTITDEELAGGPCPECLDARGERCRDFDPVRGMPSAEDGYRCEACGVRVGWK